MPDDKTCQHNAAFVRTERRRLRSRKDNSTSINRMLLFNGSWQLEVRPRLYDLTRRTAEASDHDGFTL